MRLPALTLVIVLIGVALSAQEPNLGVRLFGGSAPPPEVFIGTDPGDDEDLTEPGDLVDVGTTTGVGVAPGFQRMTIELEPITVPAVGGGAAPDDFGAWSLLVDFWTALRGPVVYAAEANASLSSMLVSLGESQGDAFRLSILNRGLRAVKVHGDGLVLEPLKNEAVKAAQRELAKFTRGVTNLRVKGFCLDEALLPPAPGMIFRVAPPNVQKQFGSMRKVLRASRTLFGRGELHPDSNPLAYLDSIKQWSTWVKRENWDQARFGAKFIEHTRTRLAALKRPWSPDVERVTRGALPGRWSDISAVLALANRE